MYDNEESLLNNCNKIFIDLRAGKIQSVSDKKKILFQT